LESRQNIIESKGNWNLMKLSLNHITRYVVLMLIIQLTDIKLHYSQNIKLNEVSSANLLYPDNTGKYSDWIELYNPNTGPLLLSDYYISDDITQLNKFQLPPVVLTSQSYILIYADGKGYSDSTIHANFKLAKEGDTLFICDGQGAVLDFVVIPELNLNVSYGRSVNGTGNWGYFNSPTPGQSNATSPFFSCQLRKPLISNPSGSYSGSITTEIINTSNQGTIHYTLDGTEPEPNSFVYSGHVPIDYWNRPNGLSLVPTNPSFNYPTGAYTDIRAHNRGWLPPYNDVENIAVLKAKTYQNGCISSETAGATYLINQPHNFPVISLLIDSLDLFDGDYGIYHYGNDPNGNYNQEGFASEREVIMHYFSEDGSLVFEETLGLRIAGGGSRHSAIKNLSLYFRKQYGNNQIRQQLFNDNDLDRFETFLLRSGGHRPDCLPKDELGAALTKGLSFERSDYIFAAVYVNGEYWGIHSLKQKLDEDHLHNKYEIEKDDIVLLFGKNTVNHGVQEDAIHYTNMVEYAYTHDLNNPDHYAHIDSLMDVQNYSDYMISQLFLGNADWPYSNIKFWRKRVPINTLSSKGHDGKYRWILYDLDGSFGGSCNDVFVTFNTLNWATSTADYEEYTRLFRSLLDAENFRINFINRACDLLNSKFLPAITRHKNDEIINVLDNQILDHVVRWRYPSVADSLHHRANEIPNLVKWDYLGAQRDTFLLRRPFYLRNHMKAAWNLADTSKITLDVNDHTMGKIQINTLLINDQLEGATSSTYPWKGTYFQDIAIPLRAIAHPGYRFVQWLETGITQPEISVTISGDTIFTAVFEIDPDYTVPLPLVINEFMSGNQSYMIDEYNEYDDWLELYNPNNVPLDLSNYALTDNPHMPLKYTIDLPIQIPAHGFVLFWCDNQTGQGIYHTNFSLNNTAGEFLGLYNKTTHQFEDSLSFTPVPQNHSFGRESDGSAVWIYFDMPTPMASNQTTSIPSIRSEAFYVYPNPNSSNVLNISKSISGTIYTITGVNMGKFTSTQTLDISNLKTGIYLLKTIEGNMLKFVIIK
jgi:hypothetical protein